MSALTVLFEGDAFATPPLDLPWRCGSTYSITQSHHIGTHRGKGGWAWDADMQDGDPIFAVAPGVIRAMRDDSDRYGCQQEFAEDANYVILAFDDGTEALYLHLQQDSVAVAPGERVARGQFLGRVGKSGRICGFRDEGVHLHFQIQEPCEHWYCNSIPARFDMLGDPFIGESLVSSNCGAPPRCAVSPASPRVLDDQSRCFTKKTEWFWTEPEGGHDGNAWTYTYTSDASQPQAVGTWTFEVQAKGRYRVEAFMPTSPDAAQDAAIARSTRARYILRCAKQKDESVQIEQSSFVDSGARGSADTRWASLFERALEPNQRCEVILGDATGERYREENPVQLAFDALRVTPLEVDTTEDKPLDEQSPWLPPRREPEPEFAGGRAGADREATGCAAVVAEPTGAPGALVLFGFMLLVRARRAPRLVRATRAASRKTEDQ